jgi:hypothetical protein
MAFILFVVYCFGDIMSIRDNFVCQKGVLCFVIYESYVRSVKMYGFIRKYAAVPIQLKIVIFQYIVLCVLIEWAFVFSQFNCFCQFLMDNFG